MSASRRTGRPSTAAQKPIKNEGQRLLLEVHRRLSFTEIARSIGVGRSSPSFWASGDRVPTPSARHKIERLYGIPFAAWDRAAGDTPDALYARRAAAKDLEGLARELREDPGHAWIRERGRIECARCGMRAHWPGANDPCAARALGAKRDEDVLRAIRTRGVPRELAERTRKVSALVEGGWL